MKVIYNNKEVANTTLNYNELFNKPLLNSHELVGNTSLNDIGVYSKPQVDNLIASTRSIKVVSALPTPLVANTMYYVGPDQNNLYHIYLVDSSLTLIDLGMSQDAVYLGGNGIDISSDNEISVVFDNETLMLNSEGELYVRPATENVEGVVSYDNVSIKKNSSGKIYVNNSDTIVGNTDANKIGMTKNAIQKHTRTLVGGDSGGTVIAASSDLNTTPFTAVGSYVCNTNTAAAGLSNCPSTIAFRMIVENVVHNNINSIDNGSGFTTRVRTVINYAGDQWVQYVERSASNVITYGAWNKVLTSGTLSNTIVGTTDADKLALTKSAVHKYTDTLVSGNTAIAIAANADLNTLELTAVGNYVCSSSSTAQTLVNCPTKIAFKMSVESLLTQDVEPLSTSTTWHYVLRTLKGADGGVFRQQVYVDGSNVVHWGAWRPLVIGETTTSGNRFDVYPYTTNTGTTAVGKAIGFYASDTDTSLTGAIQWDTATRKLYLGDYTQSPATVTTVLTSDLMSQMPEVIEVNAVTNTTVTTWKGNSYGVAFDAAGAGLTSGASGVKRVKCTLALTWTAVQNPTNLALAPVSGNTNNYFKLMSGLTTSAAVTPIMVSSAKASSTVSWALAPFDFGTVYESIVWYDAIRALNNSWHIDFTVSVIGSQACLSGTILTRNIAADATPRIYIGNASTPNDVVGILEIYR